GPRDRALRLLRLFREVRRGLEPNEDEDAVEHAEKDPTEPTGGRRRIQRLEEIVLPAELGDHRDEEDQHYRDRDEREGELDTRRDPNTEVQHREQERGEDRVPDPHR